MTTDTVKQKILQVVKELPESATFEDAIERLCKSKRGSVSPMPVRRCLMPKPFVSFSNDSTDLYTMCALFYREGSAMVSKLTRGLSVPTGTKFSFSNPITCPL